VSSFQDDRYQDDRSQDDRYQDGDHTAVREPVAGQQQQQPAPMPSYVQPQPSQYGAYQQHQYPPAYGYGPPQGYGYGGTSSWGMRPRREYPIETKPFFLTSEFVGSLLAILGIAITAAASDAFGAWRAWILITAIVVGYMVSRGIAKSGTRSHSSDPRENLDLNWGQGDSGHDS
jgi:hypothetical protein